MILYGASGHAKVICSIIESKGDVVQGIFDDNPNLIILDSYNVLGKYNAQLFTNEKILISIGDNFIRKKVSTSISHQFGIAIHHNAIIDKIVEIGYGSAIFHNTVIQRGTKIGIHCIVNTSASLDHDCFIGNFVHISPNATLCGNIQVGEGTQIGAGATVLPNLKIGKWCKIGAGAVVTKDIPDYSVVVGVPGKIIKQISIHE
jgi:sugar O-acyltransferase (sialic acid O-acetyltransferase NeuD family)